MRNDWGAITLDMLERAGWTAGQQFLAVLVAASSAQTVFELPWTLALGTAVGAAAISVVATFWQVVAPVLRGRGFWGDLLARLVKTFAASLLGALGITWVTGQLDIFEVLDRNVDFEGALNLALLTTVLALGKGLLARGADGASGEATASTLDYSTYARATAPTPRAQQEAPVG